MQSLGNMGCKACRSGPRAPRASVLLRALLASALLSAAACAKHEASKSETNGPAEPDAGERESGGAGGTTGGEGGGAEAAAGGAGNSGAGGVAGIDYTTGGRNPPPIICDDGLSRSAIVSSDLGTDPLRFEPSVEVTSTEERVTPLRNGYYGSALTLHPSGLFIASHNGFWDVVWDRETQWVPLFEEDDRSASRLTFLSGDLDGDEDADAISFGWIHGHADGDAEQVVSIWERTPDGLVRHASTTLPGDDGATSYEIVAQAEQHVLADVDGDADLDLVTFRDGAPRVQRNQGALALGELEALTEDTIDPSDMHVAALDLRDRDADADLDLVVALRSNPNPSVASDSVVRMLVYHGDATGDLELAADTHVAALTPSSAEFGDLTGDGIRDLFLARINGNEQRFMLLVGTSEDTFEAAGTPFQLTTWSVYNIKVVDLDDDGVHELAARTGPKLATFRWQEGNIYEGREYAYAHGGATTYDDEVFQAAEGNEPARVHTHYLLRCPGSCDDDCEGRCVYDQCIDCLSDADCSDQLCFAGDCVDAIPGN